MLSKKDQSHVKQKKSIKKSKITRKPKAGVSTITKNIAQVNKETSKLITKIQIANMFKGVKVNNDTVKQIKKLPVIINEKRIKESFNLENMELKFHDQIKLLNTINGGIVYSNEFENEYETYESFNIIHERMLGLNKMWQFPLNLRVSSI